jgi:AcrR family transcriptional regulator
MSAQDVSSHQRSRIFRAMTEIAGEEGYDAVTVRELSSLAGVSTRAFYKHFQDKDECVLQTYEMVVQRAAARIAAAQSGERDWRERLRRAFAAFAHEVASKPQAARLALLEPYAVGPTAIEQLSRTDNLFETMIVESFARAPERVELPPLVVKGIVAGVARVTRALLLADRERELPKRVDELLQWTLSYRDLATSELERLDRHPLQARHTPRPTTEEATEEDRYVREDDRALIITAITKLATAEGYQHLTVPRIRTAAGVSRRNFDAHFDGVDDCFLAALERRIAEATQSAASQATGQSWAGDVYHAITALCSRIARDPTLAKLAFVEVVETGPSGIRCREGIVKTIAESFEASAPPPQRPGELAAEASVGAVWGVLHHYVTSGRPHELPRIGATLSYLALAPAVGAPVAIEAIRQEQARF